MLQKYNYWIQFRIYLRCPGLLQLDERLNSIIDRFLRCNKVSELEFPLRLAQVEGRGGAGEIRLVGEGDLWVGLFDDFDGILPREKARAEEVAFLPERLRGVLEGENVSPAYIPRVDEDWGWLGRRSALQETEDVVVGAELLGLRERQVCSVGAVDESRKDYRKDI